MIPIELGCRLGPRIDMSPMNVPSLRLSVSPFYTIYTELGYR